MGPKDKCPYKWVTWMKWGGPLFLDEVIYLPLLPNWFARAHFLRETDGLSGSLFGMESEVGIFLISLHPRKSKLENLKRKYPLEKGEIHLQTTSFAYSMLHEFSGNI